MANRHYSLRWNNHESHVVRALDHLLESESLVDVTIVSQDISIRAHKVVLSACSPYFQKILRENSCKHPIVVLKDISGWQLRSILDFMYKGETSVPEDQLTSLIKAAESLKIRGLTSSENGYSPHNYSPSSAYGSFPRGDNELLKSSRLSPLSPELETRARASPAGGPPRRKQARPRRRSGDSIGNSSLDLSKTTDSSSTIHSYRKTPESEEQPLPENLSMKRPSSSPAINLVKTETLLEDRGNVGEETQEANNENKTFHHPFANAVAAVAAAVDKNHFLSNGLHQKQEQEARVEALHALNFMAAGGGLPPHFHGGLHPLNDRPISLHTSGRSANGAPLPNSYVGRGVKGQHSAPRGGPPRSWTNDELTKALQNVWNKRMTTSQASRVFGIPYNSLLMYVRGKYGKSLKLDALKKTTPAAHDNSNTIGNSRSTPKEKKKIFESEGGEGGVGGGSSSSSFGLYHSHGMADLLRMLPPNSAIPRIKDLVQNLQSQRESLLSERDDEDGMPEEEEEEEDQSPYSESLPSPSLEERSLVYDSEGSGDKMEDIDDKEKQIQAILNEARKKDNIENEEEISFETRNLYQEEKMTQLLKGSKEISA